jgi:hypothetical protein
MKHMASGHILSARLLFSVRLKKNGLRLRKKHRFANRSVLTNSKGGNVKRVFFFFVAVLMIVSCAKPKPERTLQEQLQVAGVMGEHTISLLSNEPAIHGSMQGSFFFGCGGVSGTTSTENTLRFSWTIKPNQYLFTTIPEKQVQVVIDSTKDVPTVEFKFNEKYIQGKSVLSEKSKINPNRLFDDSWLFEIAIIRISQSTLEHESCLPH